MLVYNKIIKDLYPDIDDKSLRAFHSFKETPILDKDKYKDGIHIQYPYPNTKLKFKN